MKKLFLLGVLAASPAVRADLDGSYILPIESEALNYYKAPLDNPITRFAQKLAAGTSRLYCHPDLGYLPALLQELDIPVSSQVLVFSKTSFQASKIAPYAPRALYFNDDVYAGYVKGGDVMEISVADPNLGAIFYTLDQGQTARPKFDRREECIQCHVSPKTLGVPGHLLRSVFTRPDGSAMFHGGSSATDHRSPLAGRWGGWYVTGTTGAQTHMGNVFATDEANPESLDRAAGLNVTGLSKRFNTNAYLSGHSDIVALMVLAHQVRMHNLITRVNFETKLALYQQAGINKALGAPAGEMSESTSRRIRGPAEELLRYLLFLDEAPLKESVRGTSGFTAEFPKRKPADGRGRSLREFDLRTRLFKYPCSYLIYSEAFDSMAAPARDYTYSRLFEILSGKDRSGQYERLAAVDRQAILEILRATKPGLPDYWSPER